MAANISTQPMSSRADMASWSRIQPKTRLNTDSRLMSRDATVGSVSFWATIWRV